MRSVLHAKLLGCFVLCCAACDATAGGAVACRAVQAPPVVDGNLTDAAWAKDGWATGFSVMNAPERQAEAQTRFQVVSDGAHLCLAAELAEPRVGGIRAKETKRDGHVHNDDCMEIFLDPQGERSEYFHLAVNAAGVLYDAEVRQGGFVMTKEWDCGWRAATRIGDTSWTVEAQIPLAELGLTRKSLGAWSFNVTRERRAGRQELSSFAPITGGFHQPSLFAALRLEGADMNRFLWSVREPHETGVVREGNTVFYAGKTFVENQTGSFQFFNLVPSLVMGAERSPGAAIPDGLDAGQSREYAFKVPVTAQGDQILEVRVEDRRAPGRMFAVKKAPVRAAYQPIVVTLTRPWYRDNIYATEKLDSLAMTVELGLPPELLESMSLRAALRREGDATVLATGRQGRAAGRNELVVPVPELATGRYELVVQAVDAAGKVAHEAVKRIRRLPPVAHEWRLGEGGVLLHNGEPYLPFGWFAEHVHAMAAPDCPYTAMHIYGAEYMSDKKMRAFLDTVAAAGTYVLIGPYPSTRLTSPASVWGRPFSDKEAEALRARTGDEGAPRPVGLVHR